jgi:hypothetical protein
VAAYYHFGVGTDARAVLEHMKRRLERGAHAALGVAEGASAQAARVAFLQLTKVYHPVKFARETPDVVRQANEVFLALRAAYDSIAAAQRKSSQVGPARDAPASPAVQGRRDRDSPSPPRREGTPVRGVPIPPMERRDATPVRGVPIQPTSERREGTPVRGVPIPASQPAAAKPATDPGPPKPPALGVTIKPGVGGRVPATATPRDVTRPLPDLMAGFTLPSGVVPGTEEADLEVAMHLLRRKNWGEARRTLHALAARNSKEKKYRALLSYARGREAQDAGRHDEARTEFTRALQLDRDLAAAKSALAQITEAEPPEKPSGGLLSRLFKK